MDVLGGRHGLFGMPVLPMWELLIITYALLIGVGIIVYRVDHSHLGRAIDAVLFDPQVASALGIDTARLSIGLQLVTSAIGGVAGVIYANTFGGVFPEAFGFPLILQGMTTLVFGGQYTMWGTIIAAPILWMVTQVLPEALKAFSIIIYGSLLIVMLLVRPIGIIDRGTTRAISRFARTVFKRPAPSYKP
jgi:branched-chain amino acid transport system permease protein